MIKNKFFMLLMTVATIFGTVSCGEVNPPPPDVNPDEQESVELDATAKDVWYYFTTAGVQVGSGNDDEIAQWDARNDWDFAIQRYVVRTKVGVYIFAEGADYASITETPDNAEFVSDAFKGIGMPSKRIKVSNAVVAKMQGMPPTWVPSSLCAVLSADQKKVAVIQFVSYQKPVEVDGVVKPVSGHVSFTIKEVALGDFTVVKGKDDPEVVNMSDGKTWQYYTIDGIFVGSGATEDNEAWKARNDWDFAFKMSNVKTNSGTSTVSGKGGAFRFDDSNEFESITSLPTDVKWTIDEMVDSPMGGAPESKSTEKFIVLDMSEMPPVFKEEQNVFAIRLADGNSACKIIFKAYSTTETGDKMTTYHISGLDM